MSAKWSLFLLVILLMGCEHTMGSAGFVGMALHRDMTEAQGECDLSEDEWLKLCDDEGDKVTSMECPKACWPSGKRRR